MKKSKQKFSFWRNYGLLFEALNFTFWKSIIFPLLFFVIYPVIFCLQLFSASLSLTFPNVGHLMNFMMTLSLFSFPKIINELKQASIFEKFLANSRIIYKTYFVLFSYIFLILFAVYIWNMSLLIILTNVIEKMDLDSSKWDYLGIFVAGIQFAIIYTVISLALIAFFRNTTKIAVIIGVIFTIVSLTLMSISDGRFSTTSSAYISELTWAKIIYYILPFRYPASNLTLSISENPDVTIFTYKTIFQKDIFSLMRFDSNRSALVDTLDDTLDKLKNIINSISNNVASENTNTPVSPSIPKDRVVVEWWEQILNLLVPFVFSGILMGSFITRQISYKK